MAKREIFLKFTISTTSLPFLLISRLAELLNVNGFCTQIESCLKIIDTNTDNVPFSYIEALILAEDHRNSLHFGVDPIAIARALYVRITTGEIQGASTIDQQLVRVVTGCFGRTFARKLREQVLAIAIRRRRSRLAIASAYLSIAYYGTGLVGMKGLKYCIGKDLSLVNKQEIYTMIAQLKYPKPLQPSAIWYYKINHRVRHVALLYKSANLSKL